MSETKTTTNPMDILKMSLILESDERLVDVLQTSIRFSPMMTNGFRESFVVECAATDILCERHPALLPVLDAWESDLDSDVDQSSLVVEWMSNNR